MVPADMAALAAQLYADGRTANQISSSIGISIDYVKQLIRTAIAANPGIKDQHDRYGLSHRRHYHTGQGVLVMDAVEMYQDTPTAAERGYSRGTANPWEI